MMRSFLALAVALAALASSVLAAEPAPSNAPIKATFSITGLHCPPCARTVESSLRGLNGVRAARVDYATKSAKIEFDEHAAPLQLITSTIASTPHMMGAGMNYGSRLALSVPDLKDEATAKTARDALAATPGVASVTPYAAQHTVSVQFGGDGKPTTSELIAALRKAGLNATTY